MIKTLAYFPFQCAQNSYAVMNALLESAQRAGITLLENSMEADAVVIWSVLWSGRMRPNKQVYDHYRAQGKPVIIVEVGALHRGRTWKIALNNITLDGYYGHTENLDWDRPKKLGISLAMSAFNSPEILISAQHRHSLQVAELASVEAWIYQQIIRLK